MIKENINKTSKNQQTAFSKNNKNRTRRIPQLSHKELKHCHILHYFMMYTHYWIIANKPFGVATNPTKRKNPKYI